MELMIDYKLTAEIHQGTLIQCQSSEFSFGGKVKPLVLEISSH